jgi:hypothetical protein
MVYYLGKAFWLFAAPTSALILISGSAGLFAVVSNSPWAAWLAATAACGLVIAGFTPIGLALTVPLETRFPRPRPDPQVPGDGIIILPGGAGEGIAALSKLGQEYPNARLALCGFGPAGKTLGVSGAALVTTSRNSCSSERPLSSALVLKLSMTRLSRLRTRTCPILQTSLSNYPPPASLSSPTRTAKLESPKGTAEEKNISEISERSQF